MKFEDNKMASNLFFENWTSDQVAEWLRGLDMDDAMIPYMHYFMAGNVDGKRLMMMTHSDLEKLNVLKFGHQELILEAIDLLRNLRYGYETENLQTLALQLGCKARSLKSEVRARASENDRNRANMIQPVEPPGGRRLTIGILSSVADLVCTLKSLVAWMDKAPFSGFHDLCLTRNSIVKHGLDLINMCQRESSIPDIEFNISNTMASLSEICEKLVIGSTDSPLDPLYLQPASLELATIRKKPGEELSPADLCGKIEKGDEVIQVNQQIVAGWSLKKLVNLLKENPKEVTLLLKKRPRHIVPYGQMPHKKKREVQASTLPKSRKKLRSRDGDSTKLRPTLPEFVNTVPSPEEQEDLDSPKETNDGNDTDNDVFRSGSESPQFQQFTLPVHADPKQRRATLEETKITDDNELVSRKLNEMADVESKSHETINKEKDTQENGKESEKETDKDITNLERSNQSPERLLDSSTDSVPPSESSMESSQTYTSSLESSSHSPPLEESIHSEKLCLQSGWGRGTENSSRDRRISCKDLGQGDCQGWLYKRRNYSESDTDDTGSQSSLSMPQPEVRASQEDLSVMIRKQSQRAQNLFGEDKNKQRRRTMSRDYEKLVTPEVIAYKKRQALERTLKARERELEQLEQMLSCTSRENLHTLKRTMKKRLETDSD
ncbi:CNKR3-like protein [Mya arenaria]|uniref:CNKR3-like protein n=1 Tax=Mya arenaria TaxID=6604 RepID=A0ABY7EEC9_MYAAR|nr:CNKR3-like protein [Mya arenaria]